MSVAIPISTSNPTKITYNLSSSSSSSSSSHQQPQTHPIAHFNSKPHPNPTSSLLDVNSSYILYSVKNGLVRVMDRNPKSNLRTLLRGHTKRISDVSFFNNQSNRNDVLGTVAGREGECCDDVDGNEDEADDAANVLIWRIYKRESELVSEKLLEIRLKDAMRIVWHPFNPNQFILLHNSGGSGSKSTTSTSTSTPSLADEGEEKGKGQGQNSTNKEYNVIATFVETTRLMTIKHETENHAVCTCAKPDEIDSGSTNGGSLKLICFGPKSKVGIHDLSWSNQDARHVITAHKDGSVKLWDLRETVYLDVNTGEEVDEGFLKQLQQQKQQAQQQQQQQKQDGSVGSSVTNHMSDLDNLVESAKCIMTIDANVINEVGVDTEVRRCMFLPSYEDASFTLKAGGKSALKNGVNNMTSPFLTVTKRGSCVSLWSPFTTSGSPPSIVRTFELCNSDPAAEYNVSLCTVPNAIKKEGSSQALPSSFVLFADKTVGNIHALHLNSLWCTAPPPVSTTDQSSSIAAINGFDYIIPFRVTQPIYSWTTLVSALSLEDENGVGEEGWTLDLFCVQSKSVQQLTLTNVMLMSNSKVLSVDQNDLPDGLTVEDLVIDDNDNGDVGDLSFENEEYEVEEDDEGDIEYDEYDDEDQDQYEDNSEEDGNTNNADGGNEDIPGKDVFNDVPPPPMPNFFGSNDDSNPSSFSNWLGNLAAASATTAGSQKNTEKKVEAVVPPTPQVTPATQPRPDVDISNVPLPTVPDVEPIFEHQEKVPLVEAPSAVASLVKPKPTQRYLSPIEILASAKKETKKVSTTPVRSEVGINGKGQFSTTKPEKKESKKKSTQKGKNTQPVPIPSKDGKIAILKREDITTKKAATSDIKPVTAATLPSSTVGVTKEEVEDIVRRAVSGHFQKQENIITAEIQKAVRYEVQSGLVPTLNKTVAQTLDQTISKTMKSTVAKSVKESTKINTNELATEIASKLKDPLVDSFYKSMRELMIPAYESGTRQMFDQISLSIEKGLDLKQKNGDESVKAMEAMSQRMDAMAKTMEVLIQGVAKISVVANAAPTPSTPSAPPMVDKVEALKVKIRELVAAEDFERAFTTALSASNPDVAVMTCKSVDLSLVLESETPKLSQPIMLCLMQQLGADFSSQKDEDLKVKLSWLQSIALTLDPYNDSIKKHFAGVCQQLTVNLQTKITEPNVLLRREMQMLIQVIRGIGRS